MNNIVWKVLVLGLFCINVQAAERLYKIELVIFAQDMPTTETFDQTESKVAWPRKVVDRSSYQRVKSEKLSLKGSYSKLARGGRYQPLMHVSWIQGASANSYSRAVKISNAEGTINGFFMLQRGHLVHMIADIEYSPDPYEDSVIYRLNEKRRFKFNETHYLDHPKFGILAQISPVTN